MRILFTTDWHLRGTNPRNRVDDFRMALIRKVMEVFGIAAQYECDLILHGGDMFDSPDPSYSVLTLAAGLLRKSPCPVWITPGNHDIFAYQLGTLPRTALGVMAELGMIDILPREWTPFFDGQIMIAGAPCDTRMDKSPDAYAGAPRVGNMPHILVAHGMLMPTKAPFGRSTALADVRPITNADIVLSGDYHMGYPITVYDEWTGDGLWLGQVKFANPGALARLSAGVNEIDRPVQVALVTIGDYVEIEYLSLRSAQPGSEVLDRSKLEEEAEREANMQEFVGLIQNTGERRYLNITEIVEALATEKHLPASIVKLAQKKIASARERGSGKYELYGSD